MEAVTVSPKYQIVIPKSVREEMELSPGEKLFVILKEGTLHILRVGDIKSLKGRYAGLDSRDAREKRDRHQR